MNKKNLRSKGTNRAGQFNEAYLDSMRSLKILQEAISHESGREVKDYENAYLVENQMSSRNKIQEETYQRDFFKPLCKVVAEVCKGKKEAYRELLDYLWLNTVLKEMFICALRLLLMAQNIRRIIMLYVLTRQINALCYRVDKVDVYFGVDTGDDKI